MSSEAGKYARFELERRFLLDHLPEGTNTARGWLVTDRYIHDTRLRLRRMEPIGGGDPVCKLGKKGVPSPPDFSHDHHEHLPDPDRARGPCRASGRRAAKAPARSPSRRP